MVPIIIGFLASVVGLGGIGQKIRAIVQTLQKPITKALDFVIKTGLKLAGPIIRGIKGISGKVKAKVAAGKAWVKGKVEAGKEWAKGKVEAGKKWAKGKVEAGKQWAKNKVAGKAAASQTGSAAALAEADRILAGKPTHAAAVAKVAEIARRQAAPLALVVESREGATERVHVQAMSTPPHVLPAGYTRRRTRSRSCGGTCGLISGRASRLRTRASGGAIRPGPSRDRAFRREGRRLPAHDRAVGRLWCPAPSVRQLRGRAHDQQCESRRTEARARRGGNDHRTARGDPGDLPSTQPGRRPGRTATAAAVPRSS